MQFNNPPSAKEMRTKNKHMKTITKFIFGFPMLALACGSIAFAQDQFAPLTPADSAAKAAAAAQREAAVGGTPATPRNGNGAVCVGIPRGTSPLRQCTSSAWLSRVPVSRNHRVPRLSTSYSTGASGKSLSLITQVVRVMATSPVRTFRSWHDPMTLTQAQFPPPRQIIGGGKICKEVRDYLAWMNSVRPLILQPRGPLRPGSCLFFGAQGRQLCIHHGMDVP